VHAAATTAEATDWASIVALYDQLLILHLDAVVGLNRAVAIAELDGPLAGLAALDAAEGVDALDAYQPLHATRADLLARAGRTDEALAAYDRALDLTTNGAERAFLETQRATAERG